MNLFLLLEMLTLVFRKAPLMHPILFLLWINRLPNFLSDNVVIFAVGVEVISAHLKSASLRNTANLKWHWAQDWHMRTYPNKCVQKAIGRSDLPKFCLSPRDLSTTIPSQSSTRDLGSHISDYFATQSTKNTRKSFLNLYSNSYGCIARLHFKHCIQVRTVSV